MAVILNCETLAVNIQVASSLAPSSDIRVHHIRNYFELVQKQYVSRLISQMFT